MARFSVSYIGDLREEALDAGMEVSSDSSYVHACSTVVSALQNGAGLHVWVRTRNHYAWLQDFFAQLRVDAHFSEESARTRLAQSWGVTMPDWVRDEDIVEQGLLTLDVKAGANRAFESTLVNALLPVDVAGDVPDADALGHLFAALAEESYKQVKKRVPMVEEALRRLSAGWQQVAEEGWIADLCEHIPDDVDRAWRLLSASSLLGSYPPELLGRVLPPDQAGLARKIPRTVSDAVPLELSARQEALTQIELLFNDVAAEVSSGDDFRKVLAWTSGRTAEEFKLIESLLRAGRFDPAEEDVKLALEAFEGCPEVARIRLASLRHVVRPAFPSLLGHDETWSSEEWIRWAVDEYVPYRDWQIRNRQYEEALEETVRRFSDWYIEDYAGIQADTEQALVHVLNFAPETEHGNGLVVILMIDCLPIGFADILDQTLRRAGFSRYERTYRYAALPTVTDYNKGAVISGRPGPVEASYRKLLSERAHRDWEGVNAYYVSSLKELSELEPDEGGAVVFLNHLESDEILHSDIEAKNRTYEEELARSFSHLSEAVFHLCDRWAGPKDRISVLAVTDHGACRVLEEERRSFDSSVISKLFSDETHRVASMTEKQAEDVPQNLWNIGYRFTVPALDEGRVHFLPRGHNTVRKAGTRIGHVHGGAAPEEVIVPVARYGLVSVAWMRPFIRFVNLDMSSDGKTAQFYVQRVVTVEIEVQNANSAALQPTALEVVAPDAAVKDVKLETVAPESTSVLSIDLYFQKAAKSESSLELMLHYSINGEDYEQLTSLPADFKSAMSGGFSLKDM